MSHPWIQLPPQDNSPKTNPPQTHRTELHPPAGVSVDVERGGPEANPHRVGDHQQDAPRHAWLGRQPHLLGGGEGDDQLNNYKSIKTLHN